MCNLLDCSLTQSFHSVCLSGDTIASVNDASVEGYKHKEMVELIRSAGNYIR